VKNRYCLIVKVLAQVVGVNCVFCKRHYTSSLISTDKINLFSIKIMIV
jgi:hypothetical protein